MFPKTVTIVIPTYKRPEKLRRAIQSVLDQSYRDVRILVFDNASNDETKEIVAKLSATDARVEYHCHAQNIGMIRNFNFAFKQVETPFFGVLTDDDYYLPNFVQDAMKAFDVEPRAQLSILSAPSVDESGKILSDQISAWPKEGLYEAGENMSMVINGYHPIFTGCIFRKEILKDVYFDEQAGITADIPTLVILLSTYPFYVSKTTGLYFIRHAEAGGYDIGSISNIYTARVRAEEVVRNNLTTEPVLKARVLQIMAETNNKMLWRLMIRALRARDIASCQSLHIANMSRKLTVYRLGSHLLYAISRSAFMTKSFCCLVELSVQLRAMWCKRIRN